MKPMSGGDKRCISNAAGGKGCTRGNGGFDPKTAAPSPPPTPPIGFRVNGQGRTALDHQLLAGLPTLQVHREFLFHLRTGCQWAALPAEFGDDSSVHRTMQRWAARGVFDRIRATLVDACDDLDAIAWACRASTAR
jgi:transposase